MTAPMTQVVSEAVQSAPVLDDISIAALMQDPYPHFDRVRALGSAVWVPPTRLHLVTRFADIQSVERDPEIFASTNPGSLMNQVMGHSLMRKDHADHAVERKAIAPSFAPGAAKRHFGPRFAEIADRLIDGFVGRGQGDLFHDFAAPMASLGLIEMLGLQGCDWADLAAWSQALMDGVGNYGGDAGIQTRAMAAASAIDAMIDRALPHHRAHPNPSVLSSMVHADVPHDRAQIGANVKVIVGGGLNEPRDAILTALWGLLQHPDQRQAVQADPDLIGAVFEEALRWIAPIGVYPRRVTRDTVLGDTALRQGDQLGICVGAANRDPARFDAPNDFDILARRPGHLAFGAGPHFCAGKWVARQMVAGIALPSLLTRLPNLRLDPAQPARLNGWVFRGPVSLPVLWDV